MTCPRSHSFRLPRLGFVIQAVGPRACVLSLLCLKSRCGTISTGLENSMTQKVGHISARRALLVLSLYGALRFLSTDYVLGAKTGQAFLHVPRSCPSPSECRAPRGKKVLEDVGITSSCGEASEGTWRGQAQMSTRPCAEQMQDGKQEPHQSGGRPGRSRRGPRKPTAWTELPLSTGRTWARERPAVTVAQAGPGPRWL